MHRLLVIFALGLLVHFCGAAEVVCNTTDVRNYPSSLDKIRNCTIINGNLQIVLMQTNVDLTAYDDHTLPNLRMITGYLMIFEVHHLTSVGKLLPNLEIIGGKNLFMDFALIFYKMNHTREIGLTNLQEITRGNVIIGGEATNICYVSTVDWPRLGVSYSNITHLDRHPCPQQRCPTECDGHCWNNKACQKREKTYCPDFMDDGKCVKKCPKTKFVHYDSRKCFTKEECETMVKKSFWTVNGTCINECPRFYQRDKTVEGGCVYNRTMYYKNCKGETIDSRLSLEKMKGCNRIQGSLEIRAHDATPQDFWHLRDIVSISGYLKIGRNPAITSLDFFESLREIKGETLDTTNRFSLFVYENENLATLWNSTKNLTVLAGSVGFHDNPQLCLKEITQNFFDRLNKGVDINLNQYSNGYRSVCNQKNRTIKIESLTPTNATISWDGDEDGDNRTVIGYTFYYQLAPKTARLEPDYKVGCHVETWKAIMVLEKKITLNDLTPFSTYQFYIKTHVKTVKYDETNKNLTSNDGEETPLQNFTTLSTRPSTPLEVTVTTFNDTTIVLHWEPPHFRNGNLTHFGITVVFVEDHLPSIRQRDYCEWPHIEDKPQSVFSRNEKKQVTENNPNNCSCPTVSEDPYVCDRNSRNFEQCIMTSYKRSMFTSLHTSFSNYHDYSVDANATSYEFKGLKHYSLYMFYLKACNTDLNKEKEDVKCSVPVMVSRRTAKKKDADAVVGIVVHTEEKNALIKWDEPNEVNSVLVSYNIEYRRSDSAHSKSRIECITEDDFRNNGRSYKLLDLSSGNYIVRVRAISYGGPGPFTAWADFQINSDQNVLVIVLPIVLTIVLVCIAAAGVFLWRYQKHRLEDRNHLITSINPDYAGPIYEEDEWEVDRKDVQILDEIGQGTFGMVYQGVIKSRRYLCAVKTVNEGASATSCMDFLNEGAVMKSFNKAHHVVRLLGIVSRGHPPLVIMELMERGDLKSYLRNCRGPSQNLTTNELYRMAAEVADGMAYLSSKKFIHRDLAARNCMVAADRTVKIGDFGMARDVYETDYYKKDTAGLLPVRWMSPESLADGVFTTDSDVWSYGILLWEMATLAEQPYQGMSNEEVFNYVKRRGRPARPTECSDMMYDIMSACWMWRPYDRPTFMDIVHRLVDHVGADFRLVAFTFTDEARRVGPRVRNAAAMLPASDEDYMGYYNASEDEVSLYRGHRLQRSPSPERISPGSPPSSFLFNAS